jgi:hypothetical protein
MRMQSAAVKGYGEVRYRKRSVSSRLLLKIILSE